jgi:hypothetical protein
MWSSEHTSAVELVDPDDVLAKTVYTLTNPVKDHLVARAGQWPGASSLKATTGDRTLSATRPSRFFRADGTMPKRVEIRCVRAPGFDSLSPAEYQGTLQAAVAQVERDADQERRATGRRLLGRAAVLAQQPTDRPDSREPRRMLDPRIAARDKGPRIEAISRMRTFHAEYSEARAGWLLGQEPVFPPGTWWLQRCARIKCEPVGLRAA